MSLQPSPPRVAVDPRGAVDTGGAVAPGEQPAGARTSLGTVVHLGFGILMVISVVRYVERHSWADNVWILALAASVCALYALIAATARRRRPAALLVVLVVLLWSVLVIAAPSFAWCSFALFFLGRTALTGPIGYLAGGTIVAATAAALFRLSAGSDIAMLLGPMAVGVMLTVIHNRIEQDAERQRRLHAEVSSAERRLAASERQAGIAAERERVSREIHDTVAQGLASSLLLLEAATRTWPSPSSAGELRQATALLRQNLADTRSLVHDMAAPGLDSVPLPAALLQAATLYLPGIRVEVTGQERPLSAEVRHALLRVVQSAAANIALHAAAAHATVTLGYLPGSVTLDIHDNGRGFDPDALAGPSETGGYGLRAMRQRVEQLGGAFSVESSPGEGTIVAAHLPAEDRTA